MPGRGAWGHARPVDGIGDDRATGSAVVRDPRGTLGRLSTRPGLGWMFAGEAYPAQPDGVPWPTSEWPVGELPAGFDAAAIDEFLTWALAPPEGESCCIDAVLAVQGGELVIERYSEEWDPAVAHVSWSMAKSITQAMVGILVAEGRLDVFAPARGAGVVGPERPSPRDHHRHDAAHALRARVGGGVRRARAT